MNWSRDDYDYEHEAAFESHWRLLGAAIFALLTAVWYYIIHHPYHD